MNPQHIPYYHNGQLGEVPRHQVQHAVVPPGVPMVMNQQHAYVPYGIPLQRHSRPVYHSSQQPSPHMMRHPAAVAAMPVPISHNHHPPVVEAVRVRYPVNQPMALSYHNVKAEAPAVKPSVPTVPISSAVTAEYTPLDLSAKTSIVKSTPIDVKPIAQAAIVQYTDQPLDLSKPPKPKNSPGYSQSAGIMSLNNDKRNPSLPVQKSPSSRLMVEQSGRLSASSTATNDMEQDLAGSQGLTSNSSLIGNHPIDDILYLHCARCQSSYGSIHAFRKHFRNSHGYMPSSEDVLIQSIKATKEYVMNKNEHPSPGSLPKRHCVFCGWQCEQTNPSVFSKHMQEHYDGKGCYYRCIYCQQEYADPNTLRQHVIQHSVVYQYICAVCCLAYSAEEQLASHMLTQHEVRYNSRKVNLPVSVVLPSPSSMTPVRHETSPKVHNQYLLPKMKPGYPQMYADHMQSKLTPVMPIGSPRAPALGTPKNYAHPSMQPKSSMLMSPRYDVTKVSCPTSTAYKKSYLTSPTMMPIPPAPEPNKSVSQHGSANSDLASLLDKVIEQGLERNETRAATTTTTRRVPQSLPISSYENGNRLAYNTLIPSAQPTPSHPSMLVDLSRHSNIPPTSTAPALFDTPNARHYTTTVETIDLSIRNTRLASAQYSLQSSVAPSLIDFSQKRMHAHGSPSTASSAFSTHSTYALNQSLKGNITPSASDHQKVVLTPSKPSPAPAPSLKTPVVDITGPDSSEEAVDHSMLSTSADSKNTAASTSSTQAAESNTLTRPVKQEKVEPSTYNESAVPSSSAVTNGPSDPPNQTSEKEFTKQENRSSCNAVNSNQSQTEIGTKSETRMDCRRSSIKQEDKSSPKILERQESFAAKESNGQNVKSEVCDSDKKKLVHEETARSAHLLATTCMAMPDMISSIIDRAVKSKLDIPDTPITTCAPTSTSSNTAAVDTKQTPSSNSSTAAVTCSLSIENPSTITDAIPVTWANLKDSEQSLEVDRIQAMSACRVLLNPHSFPIKSYANTATSSNKDNPASSGAGSNSNPASPAKRSGLAKKRSAENSYSMVENGALDMSKKCSVNSSSQDQSDSSACSSPKRLRIVENE